MTDNFRDQLERLPDLLSAHIFISVLALAAGIAVSLPLAILLTRSKSLRGPALAAVGVIQTIPSLALLALMVPLLASFGFWPAFVALTLYSMLPIVRNTVTGIVNVDPRMIEAARGLGMTPMQMLLRVELPLALPIIIAGVRTATVWVIGIATLSTPVGQPSLGNFIFSGLQTRNWTAVLFGCIGAAALAIALDLLIALLESGVASRSRARIWTAVSLIAIVFAGGVAPKVAGWLQRSGHDRAATVIVGSKTFTEQYILGELIADMLRANDLSAVHRQSLGSTIAFDGLRTGEIDAYVDYSGTVWANYMKRDDVQPPDQTLDDVRAWLESEHEIEMLGALGFENAYALAMRRDRASELGISSIEDLARHAPNLSIGSDYEFFARPEWHRLRDTYGLAFADRISFDSTFMYQAVADREVDVITAFSSDGRIAAFDLLVLDDPKNAFPPYDAVLLLSPRAAQDERIRSALLPLIGAIDDDTMRNANRLVDVDGETISHAADELMNAILAPAD